MWGLLVLVPNMHSYTHMSLLERLLRRLGFVRLADHGLALSPDGRVVSRYPAPRRLQAAPAPVARGTGPTRVLATPVPKEPPAPTSSAPSRPYQPSPAQTAMQRMEQRRVETAPRPAPNDISFGETKPDAPQHVDGTCPGGFWQPEEHEILVRSEEMAAQIDKTQMLDISDILEERAFGASEPAAPAPGVVPDSTRVDLMCPDFEFPGLKYDK